MQGRVLPNVFPDLVPYDESLGLSRLVLLDEVPANAESERSCATATLTYTDDDGRTRTDHVSHELAERIVAAYQGVPA